MRRVVKRQMKKLSIIVAIYNIEDYIEKCIKSIIMQKFDDYELILVNDGSTDNSEKICKKYLDNINVRYFYKKNGGLSDARNFGVERSTGEYIMFIDGDDFLYDTNCLSYINEMIKNSDCDILQYRMAYYYPNKRIVKLSELYIDDSKTNIIDILSELNRNGNMSVSACDKIVRSEIIKNKSLFFKRGIYSEDIDWSMRIYMNSKKIKILNNIIYVYRQQRKGSITTEKTQKRVSDLWKIIKYWHNYKYVNENIKKLYYNYLAYQILILVTISNKKSFSKKENMKIKKTFIELIQYNENYKVKYFYILYKIFGYNVSLKLMKLYLCLKNRGVIKI